MATVNADMQRRMAELQQADRTGEEVVSLGCSSLAPPLQCYPSISLHSAKILCLAKEAKGAKTKKEMFHLRSLRLLRETPFGCGFAALWLCVEPNQRLTGSLAVARPRSAAKAVGKKRPWDARLTRRDTFQKGLLARDRSISRHRHIRRS